MEGKRILTLTPSAPMMRSPEKVEPSSSVMVPVDVSTSVTQLDVFRTAGDPLPVAAVATLFNSLCSWTRWLRTHG